MYVSFTSLIPDRTVCLLSSQPPTVPPPSYNSHNYTSPFDVEASLPPSTLPPHYTPRKRPSFPKSSSPVSKASKGDYERNKKYRRRRIICCAVATLVLLIVAIAVFAAVFHWGNGNGRFCVRWGDGTTSGDCRN